MSLPVPGNHEYYADEEAGKDFGLQPFRDYWLPVLDALPIRSGNPSNGYYSLDFEYWRLVGINSSLYVMNEQFLNTRAPNQLGYREDPNSDHISLERRNKSISAIFESVVKQRDAQSEWLRTELSSDDSKCVLAFAHHPRYSSGIHGYSAEEVQPLQQLYDLLHYSSTSLAVSAHDHHYEQFFPMDSSQNADFESGLRTFVVGTGGAESVPLFKKQPNSEFQNNTDFGVLKIELYQGFYTWQFIASDGSSSNMYAEACVPRPDFFQIP